MLGTLREGLGRGMGVEPLGKWIGWLAKFDTLDEAELASKPCVEVDRFCSEGLRRAMEMWYSIRHVQLELARRWRHWDLLVRH